MSDASNVGEPRTNAEIRHWYLERIAEIPGFIRILGKDLSALTKAQLVWHIRYIARLEARDMMVDKAEVELLRARDNAKYGSPDGPTFRFLVERLKDAGLEGDAAYEAIIDGSSRTDDELNRILGL